MRGELVGSEGDVIGVEGEVVDCGKEWEFEQLWFFFFNDTATTEIYTLSLHDALPIFLMPQRPRFLYLPILAAAAPLLFILPITRCGNAQIGRAHV